MSHDFFGRDDFVDAVARTFPSVAADIDPEVEGGLLHLEMAALTRAAQAAIDSESRAEVMRHFRFADELFRRAGPDLKNAFYVSYLEHLNFGGHRAFAEKLLPPALHAGWVEINEHMADLGRTVQKRRKST